MAKIWISKLGNTLDMKTVIRFIEESQAEEFLSQGWIRGRATMLGTSYAKGNPGNKKHHVSWNKGTKGLTTRIWTPEQLAVNAQKNRDRVPPKLKKLGVTSEQWLDARSEDKRWCGHHLKFELKSLFAKNQFECREGSYLATFARYSSTPDSYALLLKTQDNHCALCPREQAGKRMHIDHDHKCCRAGSSCGKCIRGILCGSCNLKLGRFERMLASLTSPPIFKEGTWECAALIYLAKYPLPKSS
jgi:Recombination endonuclease VII